RLDLGNLRILGHVSFIVVFFFFQAEDGIRDRTVTGVQTCALPISGKKLTSSMGLPAPSRRSISFPRKSLFTSARPCPPEVARIRSEERRVGKEGRSRWSADHERDDGGDGCRRVQFTMNVNKLSMEV